VEQSRHYKSWSDADKQRLLELAAKAGSPGFLFHLQSYLESLKDPNPAFPFPSCLHSCFPFPCPLLQLSSSPEKGYFFTICIKIIYSDKLDADCL
jgi:hypothetical protein